MTKAGDGDANDDAGHASKDRMPVASQRELEIIRSCLIEAFWFRALPMASAAAVAVFYLIRKGLSLRDKLIKWFIIANNKGHLVKRLILSF